jgi:hypothetical protein
MSHKKKPGRNAPCPCGSGKKFKKCHGALSKVNISPLSGVEIKKKIEEMKGSEIQRAKQQGLGRPIISSVFKGHRFVAVGNRFYHSKNWKTFHDFLADYLKILFGREWGISEQKKDSADRHPILKWMDSISKYRQKVIKESDKEIVSSVMTGAVFAYLTLSYNLYLLAHNIEVQQRLVKRLKNQSLFYGALYETIVTSHFVKAGFKIELEDECEGSITHCEFVAVSAKSKNKYSIEAKTRSPQKNHFSIRNQLHKALKKEASNRRVIFIDLNVSQNFDQMDQRLRWLQDVIDELRSCETSLTVRRKPAPEAYVFVTNHPFLYNLDSFNYPPAAVAEGFKIHDFKIDSEFHNLRDALESRDKHIDMFNLIKAMKEYDKIPCTWDGEIPEYAFGEITKPRLKIGEKYLIPDGKGNDVLAEIVECSVFEKEKKVYYVCKFVNGKTSIGTYELSDLELQAYRKYPDTFFGVYRKQENRVKDALDFYDFFYGVYKNTSKEKLLELLKDHRDLDKFKEMTQEELSKTYCEISACSAFIQTQHPQTN